MLNKNVNKECYDSECSFHLAPDVFKPHIHVVTSNGSYVKFIFPKPKRQGDSHGDTSR